MIHVVATIELKPGCRDEFLDILRQNVPSVRAEEGCIAYEPTIDTETDINDAADALKAARNKMSANPVTGDPLTGADLFGALFGPSTIPFAETAGVSILPGGITAEIDTLSLHEYGALIAFEGVIGAAKGGLATASLVQLIGIVTLLTGVALIAGSLVLTQVGKSNTA